MAPKDKSDKRKSKDNASTQSPKPKEQKSNYDSERLSNAKSSKASDDYMAAVLGSSSTSRNAPRAQQASSSKQVSDARSRQRPDSLQESFNSMPRVDERATMDARAASPGKTTQGRHADERPVSRIARPTQPTSDKSSKQQTQSTRLSMLDSPSKRSTESITDDEYMAAILGTGGGRSTPSKQLGTQRASMLPAYKSNASISHSRGRNLDAGSSSAELDYMAIVTGTNRNDTQGSNRATPSRSSMILDSRSNSRQSNNRMESFPPSREELGASASVLKMKQPRESVQFKNPERSTRSDSRSSQQSDSSQTITKPPITEALITDLSIKPTSISTPSRPSTSSSSLMSGSVAEKLTAERLASRIESLKTMREQEEQRRAESQSRNLMKEDPHLHSSNQVATSLVQQDNAMITPGNRQSHISGQYLSRFDPGDRKPKSDQDLKQNEVSLRISHSNTVASSEKLEVPHKGSPMSSTTHTSSSHKSNNKNNSHDATLTSKAIDPSPHVLLRKSVDIASTVISPLGLDMSIAQTSMHLNNLDIPIKKSGNVASVAKDLSGLISIKLSTETNEQHIQDKDASPKTVLDRDILRAEQSVSTEPYETRPLTQFQEADSTFPVVSSVRLADKASKVDSQGNESCHIEPTIGQPSKTTTQNPSITAQESTKPQKPVTKPTPLSLTSISSFEGLDRKDVEAKTPLSINQQFKGKMIEKQAAAIEGTSINPSRTSSFQKTDRNAVSMISQRIANLSQASSPGSTSSGWTNNDAPLPGKLDLSSRMASIGRLLESRIAEKQQAASSHSTAGGNNSEHSKAKHTDGYHQQEKQAMIPPGVKDSKYNEEQPKSYDLNQRIQKIKDSRITENEAFSPINGLGFDITITEAINQDKKSSVDSTPKESVASITPVKTSVPSQDFNTKKATLNNSEASTTGALQDAAPSDNETDTNVSSKASEISSEASNYGEVPLKTQDGLTTLEAHSNPGKLQSPTEKVLSKDGTTSITPDGTIKQQKELTEGGVKVKDKVGLGEKLHQLSEMKKLEKMKAASSVSSGPTSDAAKSTQKDESPAIPEALKANPLTPSSYSPNSSQSPSYVGSVPVRPETPAPQRREILWRDVNVQLPPYVTRLMKGETIFPTEIKKISQQALEWMTIQYNQISEQNVTTGIRNKELESELKVIQEKLRGATHQLEVTNNDLTDLKSKFIVQEKAQNKIKEDFVKTTVTVQERLNQKMAELDNTRRQLAAAREDIEELKAGRQPLQRTFSVLSGVSEMMPGIPPTDLAAVSETEAQGSTSRGHRNSGWFGGFSSIRSKFMGSSHLEDDQRSQEIKSRKSASVDAEGFEEEAIEETQQLFTEDSQLQRIRDWKEEADIADKNWDIETPSSIVGSSVGDLDDAGIEATRLPIQKRLRERRANQLSEDLLAEARERKATPSRVELTANKLLADLGIYKVDNLLLLASRDRWKSARAMHFLTKVKLATMGIADEAVRQEREGHCAYGEGRYYYEAGDYEMAKTCFARAAQLGVGTGGVLGIKAYFPEAWEQKAEQMARNELEI